MPPTLPATPCPDPPTTQSPVATHRSQQDEGSRDRVRSASPSRCLRPALRPRRSAGRTTPQEKASTHYSPLMTRKKKVRRPTHPQATPVAGSSCRKMAASCRNSFVSSQASFAWTQRSDAWCAQSPASGQMSFASTQRSVVSCRNSLAWTQGTGASCTRFVAWTRRFAAYRRETDVSTQTFAASTQETVASCIGTAASRLFSGASSFRASPSAIAHAHGEPRCHGNAPAALTRRRRSSVGIAAPLRLAFNVLRSVKGKPAGRLRRSVCREGKPAFGLPT